MDYFTLPPIKGDQSPIKYCVINTVTGAIVASSYNNAPIIDKRTANKIALDFSLNANKWHFEVRILPIAK